MWKVILTVIPTLIGVIKVVLSLLNIYHEHKEKHLPNNIVKIKQDIRNIQLTYKAIIKIFTYNFNDKDGEFINDTKKCIHSNIERIYPILSEFDTFLFEYLPKLTNDKLYKSYEESRAIIDNLYGDTQINESIFNRQDEVTRNMLTESQKNKKYFTDAALFLEKVEKKL